MRVLLCTTDKIGSRIIRAVTWSRWSHAAIIDGDEIIEAVWPRVRVSSLIHAVSWLVTVFGEEGEPDVLILPRDASNATGVFLP